MTIDEQWWPVAQVAPSSPVENGRVLCGRPWEKHLLGSPPSPSCACQPGHRSARRRVPRYFQLWLGGSILPTNNSRLWSSYPSLTKERPQVFSYALTLYLKQAHPFQSRMQPASTYGFNTCLKWFNHQPALPCGTHQPASRPPLMGLTTRMASPRFRNRDSTTHSRTPPSSASEIRPIAMGKRSHTCWEDFDYN